jgi:hypothetical protein
VVGRTSITARASGAAGHPRPPSCGLPGDCRAPSIACDARGGLYLAFRYQNADTLRILYEQFNYMNPVAQPVVAAGYPFQPDNPIVTMAADGHGYVLWQDRRPSGEIWLAPVRHDTGFQPKRSLSSWTAPQTSYTATLDSAGALHVAWNASSPWVNEVRYMKLEFADDPDPEQLTLVAPTGPVESVALDVDGDGSLHAAYSVSGGDGVSLRYLRRWPDGYWDAGTTDLSYPGSYIGQMPVLIARRGGNLDLIYTGELAGQTRYMLRRRVLTPEAAPTLDAPAPLVTAYEPVLGPNPARAGQRIRVEGARQGDAPDALEVFDTAGTPTGARARHVLRRPVARRDLRGLDRGMERGGLFRSRHAVRSRAHTVRDRPLMAHRSREAATRPLTLACAAWRSRSRSRSHSARRRRGGAGARRARRRRAARGRARARLAALGRVAVSGRRQPRLHAHHRCRRLPREPRRDRALEAHAGARRRRPRQRLGGRPRARRGARHRRVRAGDAARRLRRARRDRPPSRRWPARL